MGIKKINNDKNNLGLTLKESHLCVENSSDKKYIRQILGDLDPVRLETIL